MQQNNFHTQHTSVKPLKENRLFSPFHSLDGKEINFDMFDDLETNIADVKRKFSKLYELKTKDELKSKRM
jgi:hypothetical protein